MEEKSPLKTNKTLVIGFCFIFLGIVILDQATKYWSEKFFLIQSHSHIIQDYINSSQSIFNIGQDNWLHFSLTYLRNTGAAWGLLGNLPEYIRPYFFYVITALAMILIVYLFLQTTSKNLFTGLGLLFILAGAMGNYIDRIYLHYVIDWIHFRWKIFFWQYDFPVFNVADCFVTAGVIVLLLDNYFNPEGKNGTTISKKFNSSCQ